MMSVVNMWRRQRLLSRISDSDSTDIKQEAIIAKNILYSTTDNIVPG